MPECLFVYGLLLPDLAPGKFEDLVCSLETVGRGQVSGRLYDLGLYPGAIVDPQTDCSIKGMVYRLPPTPAVLSQLDQFEGVDDGLYVRLPAVARLESGEELEVWIYQYNQDLSQARLLPDGDYRRRV